jgi:chitinase
MSASASDNVGVVKVEFYVNGALMCTEAGAPYNCTWKVPGAPHAKYQLQGKAYDAAGNVGSSSLVSVTAK